MYIYIISYYSISHKCNKYSHSNYYVKKYKIIIWRRRRKGIIISSNIIQPIISIYILFYNPEPTSYNIYHI